MIWFFFLSFFLFFFSFWSLMVLRFSGTISDISSQWCLLDKKRSYETFQPPIKNKVRTTTKKQTKTKTIKNKQSNKWRSKIIVFQKGKRDIHGSWGGVNGIAYYFYHLSEKTNKQTKQKPQIEASVIHLNHSG